jgi:hypothetical protein
MAVGTYATQSKSISVCHFHISLCPFYINMPIISVPIMLSFLYQFDKKLCCLQNAVNIQLIAYLNQIDVAFDGIALTANSSSVNVHTCP